MDLKIMGATFGAVFLAEVADKTQLVGIGMASKSLKPFSVFVGSVAAYAVITAISVYLGAAIGEHLAPNVLRVGGALLFVGIGVLMFFNKI